MGEKVSAPMEGQQADPGGSPSPAEGDIVEYKDGEDGTARTQLHGTSGDAGAAGPAAAVTFGRDKLKGTT